jgi:hypothetical protein
MNQIEKILIRSPNDLKDELKAEAGKLGFTLNHLILQILWNWLNQKKAG